MLVLGLLLVSRTGATEIDKILTKDPRLNMRRRRARRRVGRPRAAGALTKPNWLFGRSNGCGGFRRHAYIAPGNFGDGSSAREAHGHFQFAIEVLEDALHSHPASERETVEHGAADGDGVCAESQGLEDILAAPDAAIDDDGGAAVNGTSTCWSIRP